MTTDNISLPGVTIRLMNGKSVVGEELTDVEGEFNFVGIRPNRSLHLVADLVGFKVQRTQIFTVNPGDQLNFCFALKAGRPLEAITVTDAGTWPPANSSPHRTRTRTFI